MRSYYWSPTDGAVARSDAYSGWSIFGCVGDPSGRNSYLGVRATKKSE
ncbi:MAG: hypothetical protein KJ905_00005 [Nanoarchaeota archaeon]|nr:hypothetical protein [Nanoarchaeota archaeon]MBU2458823.1 hypothetical protein [Nanoarchaeota archaeon]